MGSKICYEYKDDLNWIRVLDLYPENHRYLHFEDSIQGAIDLRDHRLPVFEYICLMAYGARLLLDAPARILIGGLGSCGLLHAVASWWPDARIISVEYDSRIYELAKRFFRLSPHDKVLIGDLRACLEQRSMGSMDLVFVDCYSAVSIPPHLTTLEFARTLKDKLAPDGLLVCNLWSPACNELSGDQILTVLEVFGEVALVDSTEDQNIVLFARVNQNCDWPAFLELKGYPFPFRVVRLDEPQDWPHFMAASSVISDQNLHHFFEATELTF